MDELIKEINKYPNGTILSVKWKNNVEIKGEIDTIYETDNGLDMDEEGYHEFYACILKVLEVSNIPSEDNELRVGNLIEISMQNPPLEISLDNKLVIWGAKN